MYYHYQRRERCITPRFIINMLLCDVIVILAVLIGHRWYANYMVTHDVKTIKQWCQQIECVYIDPNTGIGYPAAPEVTPADPPEQVLPANLQEV
jgi:ABC-type antimicrobial peptide transport system ATPase subunit